MLLAVLAGVAGLLGILLAGAIVSQRRTGSVPGVLRHLSGVSVLGVSLIAGVAVVALSDEAAALAAVFVAIVLVPLGAIGIYLQRVTELSRLDTLATAGFAWSIPFLFGLAVTFGVPTVFNLVLDLAPAESRQVGLYWIAPALGAIVVVLGALRLSTHVRRWLYSNPSS
jgi:hypothetical protein